MSVVGAVNDTGKASVSGLGTWNLTPDSKTAQSYTRSVIVTPEECGYTSGNSEVVQGAVCARKTYKITANRAAASTDATLKSLSASYVHTTGSSASTDTLITSSEPTKTIDLGSIAYGATTLDFTAIANQNDIKKMSIKVNGGQEKTISISGTPVTGTATCALAVGDNTCVIKVTAEDETTAETYTIKAHRRSNDASLKTFTVSAAPNPNSNTLQPSFPSSSNDTYSLLYNEKGGDFCGNCNR